MTRATHSEAPTPRETIQVIDQLVLQKRLSEDEFKAMHHFGGSIAGFRRYCGKIQSFQSDSKNRKLADKLFARKTG